MGEGERAIRVGRRGHGGERQERGEGGGGGSMINEEGFSCKPQICYWPCP